MNSQSEVERDSIQKQMIDVQNKMQRIKNGPVVWSKEREDEYERLRDLYCQLYDRLVSSG